MKHGNRTARSVRRIVAAAVLAAATLTGSQGTVAAQEMTKVKLPTYPIAGLAALKIAQDQGYLKQEGIEPEWVPFRTPADGIANLMGGKLDLTIINVGGLAAAAVQHLPLKAISVAYYTTSDFGIYVRKDSPINSVKDLKGKTIALVQLKNNVHGMVMDTLERNGVDPYGVKFTLIPIANILSALRAGTVEAAQIVEPFIADGGDSIKPIIPSVYGFSNNRGILAYFVITKQFAQAHPETVTKLKRAIDKAQDFAAKNPDAVRKAAASLTEISPDILEKMILPQFGTDLMLDNAEAQIDLMVKYKLLDPKPDIKPYFE